jgi:hypothetical protein
MQTSSLLRKVFRVFIFTIPFDSFPLIGTSVYRPLSILPLAVIFFISLYTKKTINLKRSTAVIFLIALSITYIKSFLYNDYGGAIKFTVEVVFISISIISILYVFRHYESKELFFSDLKRASSITIVTILTISYIQLFSRFISTIQPFTELINSLVSYRYDISRIQFLSGEPSMGVRMLVFMLCLYYISNNSRIPKLFLIMSSILILMSGSTFGIIFLLLFIAVYLITTINNPYKLFKNTLIFIVFSIITIFLIAQISPYLSPYAQSKISKVVEITTSLDLATIISISKYDGSLFLRLFNPIIGLMIFMDNFLIGVGGENFSILYMDYVQQYYPFASKHDTVLNHYKYGLDVTPKSFYSKILAEFGIFGFLVFLKYALKAYNKSKHDDRFKMLFAFLIALMINYDSYIYLPLIFGYLLLVYHNKIGYIKTIRGPLVSPTN